MKNVSEHELATIAKGLRKKIIKLSHLKKAPHLASALSCVDLLSSLYWQILRVSPEHANAPDRDRFILSKGHAALALYVVLCEQGYFSEDILNSYTEPESPLEEHPCYGSVAGIEASTGSLGHGLSIGMGHALAAKISGQEYRVFALLSDGECNEGSVWESALFGAGKNLNNCTVLIDFNKWQATARSQDVLKIDPLAQKWQAFGWNAMEINGHDPESIRIALEKSFQSEKPTAIIAHTIKGKGVSFMEDDNNWHYRIPTLEEVELANKELA